MEVIEKGEARIIGMSNLVPMIIDWQTRENADDLEIKNGTNIVYLDFVDERVFCIDGKEAKGILAEAVLEILRSKKELAMTIQTPEEMMYDLNRKSKDFSLKTQEKREDVRS